MNNDEVSEREALATLTRLLSPETVASVLTNILRHPHKCFVVVVLPPAEGQTYGTARGRSFPAWNEETSLYIKRALKVGLCFIHYQDRWWAPAPSPL